MTRNEHTRIVLAEGGNIFRQGEHVKLSFSPRDYAGNVVDLSDKDISVAIWNRKGVMYEGTASYDVDDQLIRMMVEETLEHGEFNIEFTATSAFDPSYRQKFPSSEFDGRISITPSSDNMDVVGVKMTTVAQLRQEQEEKQQTFEAAVIPRVETVEGKAAELEQRVNDGIGAFTEDTEVLDARMGEVNLREFNRKTTEKLAEKVGGVVKAKMEDLDDEVISAVTGGATVNVLSIPQNKSVTPEKTVFFTHGKNLFNKETANLNNYINQNTGNLTANVSYIASDYVAVDSGVQYTFLADSANRIAYYDANKVFISGVSAPELPITTPAGAAFVRFSFSNNKLNSQQFEKGTVNTPFEAFTGWSFDTESLAPKSVTADKITGIQSENFADGELIGRKMAFFEHGRNLYNKATSLADTSINANTGSLGVSSTNTASDFIEVEGVEYYSFSPANAVVRMAFYDEYKNFISGLSDPTSPIITPANAKYVRYSYIGGNEDVRQFEKGEVITPYEPFVGYVFKAENIKDGSIPFSKLDGLIPTGSSADGSEILVDMYPNTIYFFIKGTNNNSNKYLRYRFTLETRPFDATKSNGNLDAWRLRDLYEVERTGDFSFSDSYAESLMTDGVWEFAIKEKDMPQFMGGAHGNEVLTNVHILFDGIQKPIGTTEKFKCKNIRLVQKTTVYRVFTQTPVANAVKVYEINAKDGIELSTEIEWLESIILGADSYLPMLPIKRTLTDGVTQITDRFYRDNDHDIKDVSTSELVMSSGAGEAISGIEKAILWGQSSGISAEITLLERALESEQMYISSSALYNKFYYQFVGVEYTTSVGEKMKIVANFKLNTIR